MVDPNLTPQQLQGVRKRRGIKAEALVLNILATNGYEILDYRGPVALEGPDILIRHPTKGDYEIEVKSAAMKEKRGPGLGYRVGRFNIDRAKDLIEDIDCFITVRTNGETPDVDVRGGDCVRDIFQSRISSGKLHPSNFKALKCFCDLTLTLPEDICSMDEEAFDVWYERRVKEGLTPITKDEWRDCSNS
jgi:Holliday junction resolvase-like predicted endonuclease|tara:strand:+ start:20615 stop:21184 length:570 start_codon:yes stop_codon:yes gene_type:complete